MDSRIQLQNYEGWFCFTAKLGSRQKFDLSLVKQEKDDFASGVITGNGFTC